MKRIFTLLFLSLLANYVSAQDITGQWKGSFVDNSSGFVGFGGEKIEYVLELEANGTNVTGYSYTYFVEGGKRYYTICKLRGKINKGSKEVTVTEYERTKFNTPKDFRNCFQTHKLTYFKQNSSDTESLEGSWTPAPDQDGDCGYGKTYLTRRLLKRTVPFGKITTAKDNTPDKDLAKAPAKQKEVIQKPKTTPVKPASPPVVKNTIVPKKTTTTPNTKSTNSVAKNDKVIQKSDKPDLKENQQKISNDVVGKEQNNKEREPKTDEPISTSTLKFEKRTNKVLKTIEVEKEKITVELYDNGEIDGDSVSVFFNGKLLLSHKRLSDKPLSLTLELDNDTDANELTMYAENLGEIPPNTALMVVKDGDKRYEVRITSDTEKNGTIAFVRKQK